MPTSRFGRPKFGGTQTTLIALSLAVGLLIAAAAGVALGVFVHRDAPWLAVAVYTLSLIHI